ncbi:MAG: hypothetical protein HQ596_05365 [Candidatus Saganbacteria bacterium]|nr:hypothetical protein [Candidatus Saganbacteria bacterium]
MLKKIFSPTNLILAIMAVILVFAYFTLPELGLHSNDGGAKYMQMKNFYLKGYKSMEIDYLAKDIDPQMEHAGTGRVFVEKNGKLVCSYNPVFAYATSLFYPMLGNRAVHLFPLLCFFLSIIILTRILKMLMPENFLYYILLLTYACASPVLLYSFLFWEHMPAILLIMLSMFFLVRFLAKSASNGNLFWAFFFVSLGLFFRPETAILLGAMAAVLLFFFIAKKQAAKIAPMVLGIVVPAGAYFAANLMFYGNLIGLHGENIWGFSFFPRFQTLVFVIFFVAIFLITHKVRNNKAIFPFIDFLPIIWLGFLLVFLNKSPVDTLFAQFPLCLLLFYNISGALNEEGHLKFNLANVVLGTFIIFVSLTALFGYNNPSHSIRYLLPVIPLVFVFLAVKSESFTQNRGIYAMVILLVILSLLSTGFRLQTSILRYKFFNQKRHEFIADNTKSEEVIIFVGNPLMEHAGPLYFERKFMVINTGDEFTAATKKIKAKSIKNYYLYATGNPISKEWFSTRGAILICEKPFQYGHKLYELEVK